MAKEPILIVDDNLMNLKLAKRLLELEEYHVLTARNAEETLELLKFYRPRLILMDYGLPEVDGVELTRKVRNDPKNRDILILMVTSYDQHGDEAKSKEAGCDGYLHKPLDTQKLPEIIAGYLRIGSHGAGQSGMK